jgi:hypothetical protein
LSTKLGGEDKRGICDPASVVSLVAFLETSEDVGRGGNIGLFDDDLG